MSLARKPWLPRIVAASLAGLASLAWQPRAAAQPQPRSNPSHHARSHRAGAVGHALSAHLAPAVAQRLLRSADQTERLRGVRRLAAQADYDAVQILLRALEDNAALTSDPRFRIEATNALAPFATRDPVRRILVAWMSDAVSRGSAADGLSELAQDRAAMALAASSDARSVEQLVISIINGEGEGRRAALALEAHPPRTLEPLLSKRALESPTVIDLLGRLADLRAIPPLRKVLADADIDVQAAAAVALARLGDASGAKAARSWLERDGSSPSLRLAAAWTLTLARDPLAPRAIAVALADPATRSVGLEIVTLAPTSQLTPTLAGLLTIAKRAERTVILMALARSGGPLATRTLVAAVRARPADHEAWFALAHCRDPGANAWIASALSQPPFRRSAARAAVVRCAVLGETPDGLQTALRALLASNHSADRDIGAFGLALTNEGDFAQWAASTDPVVVAAACRAALALGTNARAACSARLHEGLSANLVDAIAGSVALGVPLDRISTRVLLDWAEQDRPSASVFASRLGERDDEAFRSRITRLMRSGSPAMRAQIALGLGRSPNPSAVALLVDAFPFEPDPWVRRAIVRALSRNLGPLAAPSLRSASRLDPDGVTRSLASLALARRPIERPVRGDEFLWLTLDRSPRNAAADRSVAVSVWRNDGLAVSALTASDGVLLIPGTSPGEVRLSIAPTPPTRQPASP